MERKRITRIRETKMRTTEESKTEVSDVGFLTKKKSEVTFESTVFETEWFADKATSPGRCMNDIEHRVIDDSPPGHSLCGDATHREATENCELDSGMSEMNRDSAVGEGTSSCKSVRFKVLPVTQEDKKNVDCIHNDDWTQREENKLNINKGTVLGEPSDSDNEEGGLNYSISLNNANIYEAGASGIEKAHNKEVVKDTLQGTHGNIVTCQKRLNSSLPKALRKSPTTTKNLLTYIRDSGSISTDTGNPNIPSATEMISSTLTPPCIRTDSVMAEAAETGDGPTNSYSMCNMLQMDYDTLPTPSEENIENDREVLENSVKYLIQYFENLKRSNSKQNDSKSQKTKEFQSLRADDDKQFNAMLDTIDQQDQSTFAKATASDDAKKGAKRKRLRREKKPLGIFEEEEDTARISPRVAKDATGSSSTVERLNIDVDVETEDKGGKMNRKSSTKWQFTFNEDLNSANETEDSRNKLRELLLDMNYSNIPQNTPVHTPSTDENLQINPKVFINELPNSPPSGERVARVVRFDTDHFGSRQNGEQVILSRNQRSNDGRAPREVCSDKVNSNSCQDEEQLIVLKNEHLNDKRAPRIISFASNNLNSHHDEQPMIVPRKQPSINDRIPNQVHFEANNLNSCQDEEWIAVPRIQRLTDERAPRKAHFQIRNPNPRYRNGQITESGKHREAKRTSWLNNEAQKDLMATVMTFVFLVILCSYGYYNPEKISQFFSWTST